MGITFLKKNIFFYKFFVIFVESYPKTIASLEFLTSGMILIKVVNGFDRLMKSHFSASSFFSYLNYSSFLRYKSCVDISAVDYLAVNSRITLMYSLLSLTFNSRVIVLLNLLPKFKV